MNTFSPNTVARSADVNANFAGLADGSLISDAVILPRHFSATAVGGWMPTGVVPTSTTNNGNRSYTNVYASSIASYTSVGMRKRFTRTVSAPTQCTSLNGTTQYYSKTSPNKCTFTDDFNTGAWVKLTSYAAGAIISRYNGTSGWIMNVNASGQISLTGYNAGAANFKGLTTYQSIPLNKWAHVAAELDMNTATNTATTNYAMIDGADVPLSITSGGTAPTALIQAGDLNVGAQNSVSFFPGKIAQAFYTTAKITQATIRTMISQGISGSETSLGSAYSFNNSIVDLNTTTPNDLTANGSAVATNADTPFGNYLGLTLEYGIVTSVSSDGLTEVVQVPEGCALPTSGGISAVAYSTQDTPYLFPKQKNKWVISSIMRTSQSQAAPAAGTWYNIGNHQLTVPIGNWDIGYTIHSIADRAAGDVNTLATLSTANNSESSKSYTMKLDNSVSLTQGSGTVSMEDNETLSAQTPYYLNLQAAGAGHNNIYSLGDRSRVQIQAFCGYL